MIKYYLNSVECNPSNRDEIEYIFDFSNRKERELELSVDALRFVEADRDAIKTWRAQYGDYVGMPLSIEYSNGYVIDYLLDFADPSFREDDISITCKVVRFKGTDNFYDNAEGLTFGSISWQSSDFVDVDYVVVPSNQFSYFISLSLATFSLAQELAKAIQEIQEGIADLVKATVPVGLPPAPDWGAIAVAAIKLAARIAYTIFIIIALIKVGTELLNLIFPKIRQFKAIKLKRLIERCCEELNFTLESSLLNSLEPATILPVPLKEKDPSLWKQLFAPLSLAYTNGYPSGRDTVQTLGNALDVMEEVFNAETSVDPINSIVRIELEEYYEQNAVNGMPIALNMQDSLLSENSHNSDEIFKRLVANFAVDPNDINTFDDTAKSLYEVSSEAINSPSINHELIRRYDRVGIPFARGTRKGSLTFVEQAAKQLAKALDLFTGGNLSAKIEARKDVMQVSDQYFGVTKLLWMNGTRLHSDQNAYIGADVIVNTYHSSRFIENNQKKVVKDMPYASTEEEIFNILLNNYVNLQNGSVAKITSLNWSPKGNVAGVDYTVKKPAINEQTVVINAG